MQGDPLGSLAHRVDEQEFRMIQQALGPHCPHLIIEYFLPWPHHGKMVRASNACLGVGCQSFVQFFKHFQHVSIGCAEDKSFIPLFWYFKHYIWIAWGILIGNVANIMSLQNQPTIQMKIKTSTLDQPIIETRDE